MSEQYQDAMRRAFAAEEIPEDNRWFWDYESERGKLMKWLVARLGEHSTQIALGGMLASVAAALQGQITWQAAGSVILGAALTAVIPAK